MKNRQLLGAVLALAATAAQGQEITWRVEFLNVMGREYGWSLEPPPSPPPFAPTTLTGLVKGEDRDRDGWIDQSELSELRFGHDGVAGNFATCGTWGGSSSFCMLERFAFAPDGPLGPTFEMTGRWYESPSPREERNVVIDTGEEYSFQFYRERYGSYYWTADTTLQVTQISPVPEPAGGLMLAAGLAALLGTRRWWGRGADLRPAPAGWR